MKSLWDKDFEYAPASSHSDPSYLRGRMEMYRKRLEAEAAAKPATVREIKPRVRGKTCSAS